MEHKVWSERGRSTTFDKGILTENYQLFARVLIDYIYMERSLEMAKCSLIKKADFNLMDSFKVFDRSNQGRISGTDILQCLREYYGYYADPARWNDQMYLVYRRHDVNMDAFLDFEEFSHLILPVTHEYASMLAGRPDFYMNR